MDAGYTSTDYVTNIVKNKPECRYLSITNADNVYGSAVVQKVLNVKPMAISKKIPDMLLNPIDSRNFMWAGTYFTCGFGLVFMRGRIPLVDF